MSRSGRCQDVLARMKVLDKQAGICAHTFCHMQIDRQKAPRHLDSLSLRASLNVSSEPEKRISYTSRGLVSSKKRKKEPQTVCDLFYSKSMFPT